MDAVTFVFVFLLTLFIGAVAGGVYWLHKRHVELSGHVDAVESGAAAALRKTAVQTNWALAIKDRQVDGLARGLDANKKDVATALGPRDAVYAKTSYADVLDLGNGAKDRQPDAGKIRYKGLSGDAVDIVGASASATDTTSRKVRVWDQLHTDAVRLGDKFSISGAGAPSTDPDAPDMLMLMDKDGKKLNGGLVAQTVVGLTIGGNNLVSLETTTLKGGKSEHNATNKDTEFASLADGKNYVRGDTQLDGNASTAGDLSVGRNANVSGRLHFGDATMNAAGAKENNTDSYYMQKVVDKNGDSSLRLTINDDDNERLDIFGGSCRIGDCNGAGEQVHSFDAAGNAYHKKSLQVGEKQPWLNTAPLAAKAAAGGQGASFGGAHHWSHFPWSDGSTYIRPGTDRKDVMVGDVGTANVRIGSGTTATSVRGTLSVEGGDANKWNWIKVARENNDVLYFGGDISHRGVWSEGDRAFSVYTGGARRFNVTPTGQVQVLGTLQVCDANGNGCRNI